MNGTQHKIVGIGFGIASAMVLMQTQSELVGPTIVVGSAIGCMLPDIDHDKTKIGSKRHFITSLSSKLTTVLICVGIVGGLVLMGAAIVGSKKYDFNIQQLAIGIAGLIIFALVRNVLKNSNTYKWMTKHRGLMHTLIPPILLYLCMIAFNAPIWHYSFLGLIIGYLSHLFADMLTVEGCPILFPLSKNNIRLAKFKTKDASTSIVAIVVAVIPVIISYLLFYRR